MCDVSVNILKEKSGDIPIKYFKKLMEKNEISETIIKKLMENWQKEINNLKPFFFYLFKDYQNCINEYKLNQQYIKDKAKEPNSIRSKIKQIFNLKSKDTQENKIEKNNINVLKNILGDDYTKLINNFQNQDLNVLIQESNFIFDSNNIQESILKRIYIVFKIGLNNFYEDYQNTVNMIKPIERYFNKNKLQQKEIETILNRIYNNPNIQRLTKNKKLNITTKITPIELIKKIICHILNRKDNEIKTKFRIKSWEACVEKIIRKRDAIKIINEITDILGLKIIDEGNKDFIKNKIEDIQKILDIILKEFGIIDFDTVTRKNIKHTLDGNTINDNSELEKLNMLKIKASIIDTKKKLPRQHAEIIYIDGDDTDNHNNIYLKNRRAKTKQKFQMVENYTENYIKNIIFIATYYRIQKLNSKETYVYDLQRLYYLSYKNIISENIYKIIDEFEKNLKKDKKTFKEFEKEKSIYLKNKDRKKHKEVEKYIEEMDNIKAKIAEKSLLIDTIKKIKQYSSKKTKTTTNIPTSKKKRRGKKTKFN